VCLTACSADLKCSLIQAIFKADDLLVFTKLFIQELLCGYVVGTKLS